MVSFHNLGVIGRAIADFDEATRIPCSARMRKHAEEIAIFMAKHHIDVDFGMTVAGETAESVCELLANTSDAKVRRGLIDAFAEALIALRIREAGSEAKAAE